ncbi:MAG: hypothetical protein ABI999_07270 [Acidobacteriota bacterium]
MSTISAILVICLKSNFVFERVGTAQIIVSCSELAAIIGFVCGALSLPKWQGFVALAISCAVIYCLLFTTMWAIS